MQIVTCAQTSLEKREAKGKTERKKRIRLKSVPFYIKDEKNVQKWFLRNILFRNSREKKK